MCLYPEETYYDDKRIKESVREREREREREGEKERERRDIDFIKRHGREDIRGSVWLLYLRC